MSGIKLESIDYEKILDFVYLDPFSQDYYQRLLSLLKTHFTGNLAAYTCWAPDSSLTACFSIGFPEEFMYKIHNYYLQDSIRQLVIEKMASNSWDGTFYSQDADFSGIKESGALDFLKENHIHYFGIMLLSADPREFLILCKTEKEGPFSERERAILYHIYHIISHTLRTRHTFQINRQALSVIKNHYEKRNTGFIITDEHRNILGFNDQALSVIPRSLNLNRINDIADYVFSLFDSDNRHDYEWDTEERSVNRNGRVFTLEETVFPNEEGKQSKYYLITISRNRQYDNRINTGAAAKYNLTERELEIAELLVRGYANKDIAETLHISLSTVKIHVSNLFRKLQVHTRMEVTLKLTQNK